ncbi:PREDICTED: F-box protein PP2-B11 [Tarenaya hassleriana]|uniref:F-box protein PP2-B11 n=1 Tax=Tarenaya hassleriana TaxID=28532 RepID=UPI00053C27EE|nr:PREDICTED: F-box protein PP2-B11 [Tarenaya hassleriana]
MGMNLLPEDCIAKILSFTSPRDVCRSSAVSKIFRSAADSDDVWNNFLPSELPVGVPTYPTRKELFFGLSDHPLLIDNGRMSFWLEKSSGKKCYMMSPRALSIVWGHDPRYWQWISLPGARFNEVAELITVWWLEISGRMNLNLLSDNTAYAAYLVFKFGPTTYGFRQAMEAKVAMAGTESETQPSMVCLMRVPNREGSRVAEPRRDGWFEVELGQLVKRRGDMGEAEMSLRETKNPFEKQGLLLHGIELRPSSYS